MHLVVKLVVGGEGRRRPRLDGLDGEGALAVLDRREPHVDRALAPVHRAVEVVHRAPMVMLAVIKTAEETSDDEFSSTSM